MPQSTQMTLSTLHCTMKLNAGRINYELQGDNTDHLDRKTELQFELLRVAYAAAQLQKYCDGEIVDSKAVRAARVYLRALSSFIGQA
jgi:hypothetical protein